MERRELRRDRLADDDGARGARQRNGRRIRGRPMVGIDRRAVAGRQVERIEQVLHRDRQPMQQSCRGLRVQCAGALHRAVGIDARPGADRGLALGDALEAIGEQRHRRDFARRELPRRLRRAQMVEASHVGHLPWVELLRALRVARGPGRRFAQVARDQVCGQRFLQHRLLDSAAIERIRATRVEAAAGGKLDRTGHIAGKNDALAPGGRIRHRDRGEQRFGVRMQRIAEQLARRRDFDDPAEIHHGDPVADVLDHGQIMRDEEIREAELALQIDQKVDDLRLHGDVERRDRLVANDQLRPRRQRPRDAETLPLSAGEFVRVLGHLVGAQADPLEERRAPARGSAAACSCSKLRIGSATISAARMRGLSDA